MADIDGAAGRLTATARCWLHTQPAPGVRQRISQRAVQDISAWATPVRRRLQGRLVALFDDFATAASARRRLANGSADAGLHSAGADLLSSSSGVPELQVVGFHRNVDWPTVERLAAAVAGDIAGGGLTGRRAGGNETGANHASPAGMPI